MLQSIENPSVWVQRTGKYENVYSVNRESLKKACICEKLFKTYVYLQNIFQVVLIQTQSCKLFEMHFIFLRINAEQQYMHTSACHKHMHANIIFEVLQKNMRVHTRLVVLKWLARTVLVCLHKTYDLCFQQILHFLFILAFSCVHMRKFSCIDIQVAYKTIRMFSHTKISCVHMHKLSCV